MENKNCPCKRINCVRHGDCEACKAHHANFKRKMSVACERKNKNINKCKLSKQTDE